MTSFVRGRPVFETEANLTIADFRARKARDQKKYYDALGCVFGCKGTDQEYFPATLRDIDFEKFEDEWLISDFDAVTP